MRDLGRAAGVTDWDGFLSNIVCYPSAVKAMAFPEGLECLGAEVCTHCPSLESLVLPGCAEIPSYAFAVYEHLREVTLGEGITRIGARAFYGCEALTAVSLPDSLKEIGEEAFYGCEALKDINLPSGLTRLGFGTFDLCTKLSDIGSGDAVYLGDENNPHLLLLCVLRDISRFSVNAQTPVISMQGHLMAAVSWLSLKFRRELLL